MFLSLLHLYFVLQITTYESFNQCKIWHKRVFKYMKKKMKQAQLTKFGKFPYEFQVIR